MAISFQLTISIFYFCLPFYIPLPLPLLISFTIMVHLFYHNAYYSYHGGGYHTYMWFGGSQHQRQTKCLGHNFLAIHFMDDLTPMTCNNPKINITFKCFLVCWISTLATYPSILSPNFPTVHCMLNPTPTTCENPTKH